ncbi:MAG: PEP-CTERM sorting domain-containing protein [Acidobacteriota bacterium]
MYGRVLKPLALLVMVAAAAWASPVIGAGAWSSWPTVNNDGTPFWDRLSSDGAACNIGYFLASGFGPCANLKNGTPANGMQLGGANLEYYSDNDAITPFLLDAGQWTFTLEGRIAGSSTFEVGYYYPLSPLPFLIPLFNQANSVGDTATVVTSGVIALYLMDGSYFFRSDADPLGVAAFRHTQLPYQFYFGFEDRPQGDRDMNDVVLSAHYVPEPGTYALIGAGLLGLGLLRRRLG